MSSMATPSSTSPQHPDRGKDVNNALSEVRTIYSRAETALRLIETRPWAYRDPELEDIKFELREIIARLSRWRRRR